MIDFRKLVKAGVHFGHQTSRWMPKMDPYIWGVKNKVHLIDVSKTAYQLDRAAIFLKDVTSSGKQILWVGTKKPAREIIHSVAKKLDMPFVNHRWIGGTLSNFGQVKKSVTRLLHFEDVLAKAEKYPHYTKKELNAINKQVVRLQAIVGGIRLLTWPIGAIVLVDVNKEASALREAVSVGVPVVALVDTDSDPSLVDYVIPANDDAPKSIQVILDYLAEAIESSKKKPVSKAKDAGKIAEEVILAATREDVLEDVIIDDDDDDSEEEEDDDSIVDKKEIKKEKKVKSVRATKAAVKKEEEVIKSKPKSKEALEESTAKKTFASDKQVKAE